MSRPARARRRRRCWVAARRARAIGARDHQPMQYGQKYRALDRKFESALGKQTLEHGAAAVLLPQQLKLQRRADRPAGDVRCSGVLAGRENHRSDRPNISAAFSVRRAKKVANAVIKVISTPEPSLPVAPVFSASTPGAAFSATDNKARAKCNLGGLSLRGAGHYRCRLLWIVSGPNAARSIFHRFSCP